MARKIDSADWFDYVPEAFGQRDGYLDGSDPNPITVEIHPISVASARAYERAQIVKFRKDGSMMTPNAEDIAKRAFLEHVRNVRNYVGKDDAPITTAEDLWEKGERELVVEIRKALEETATLEAGRLDRLSSPSAGTPPATKA